MSGANDSDDAVAHGSGRHFLFVQGPFGPFTRELAHALRATGARASRVVMCGGDRYDWGRDHAIVFTEHKAAFPRFIRATLAGQAITDLICYGDCSVYTMQAIEAANEAGIRVHVFEQGYYRPDWITLERGGVNGNSPLRARADLLDPDAPFVLRDVEARSAGRSGQAHAIASLVHGIALYGLAPWFRRYRHPYLRSPILQGLTYSAVWLSRKAAAAGTKRREREILNAWRPYFLVLMQKPGDSQIARHSPFESVEEFCRHVLENFAAHGPRDANLVFKRHPLDPGLTNHESLLRRAARAAGIADRVTFIDGGNLPVLLRASRGAITLNSTAGMVALQNTVPVICLGTAIFDRPGLTHQGTLESFWEAPQAPDPALAQVFERRVKHASQLNGSFSTREGRAMAIAQAVPRLLAAAGPSETGGSTRLHVLHGAEAARALPAPAVQDDAATDLPQTTGLPAGHAPAPAEATSLVSAARDPRG